jgi:hypothetical protein
MMKVKMLKLTESTSRLTAGALLSGLAFCDGPTPVGVLQFRPHITQPNNFHMNNNERTASVHLNISQITGHQIIHSLPSFLTDMITHAISASQSPLRRPRMLQIRHLST